MTEDDARAWIAERYPDSLPRLDTFIALLVSENEKQNLIAPASVPSIWVRHILDSAQILDHAPTEILHWVDVGTGAGFPGMIVAALSHVGRISLVEPRRKRAEFLGYAADVLGIADRVSVHQSRVETVNVPPASVISARAVASAAQLFASTSHVANTDTRYILPRGRSAYDEIASLPARWHGMFHVELSLTDPESGILIADKVCKK